MEADDCSWLAWREKRGRLVPTLHADESRLVKSIIAVWLAVLPVHPNFRRQDETDPNAAGEKVERQPMDSAQSELCNHGTCLAEGQCGHAVKLKSTAYFCPLHIAYIASSRSLLRTRPTNLTDEAPSITTTLLQFRLKLSRTWRRSRLDRPW